MSRHACALICLVLCSLLPASCRRGAEQPLVRRTSAMNTYLTVSLYDNGLPADRGNALIDSCFAEAGRIEAMASDYVDSSEIGLVNSRAGIDTVRVSAELAGLLRRSLAYAEISDGAFDIAVGPDVRLWDFLSDHPRVPPPEAIALVRPLIDYRLVSLEGRDVFLRKKGMALDLGGIAKGYTVDRLGAILRRNDVRDFIVDFGGNLGVSWDGTHMFDSTAATIDIRHPRREGAFFGRFRFGTGGISTSGDYQRYFIENGVRYHHIIDPRTGYPARSVVSVTIAAEDATSADALSTLVFVLGRTEGMKFIARRRGVEGLIMYQEGDSLKYLCSPGFAQRFVPSAGDDRD